MTRPTHLLPISNIQNQAWLTKININLLPSVTGHWPRTLVHIFNLKGMPVEIFAQVSKVSLYNFIMPCQKHWHHRHSVLMNATAGSCSKKMQWANCFTAKEQSLQRRPHLVKPICTITLLSRESAMNRTHFPAAIYATDSQDHHTTHIFLLVVTASDRSFL